MYILNIGLNNNPYAYYSINQDLHVNCKLLDWKVRTGTYNGVTEDILVASVEKCNR